MNYSVKQNVLMLIALLKAHKIKKVVVSPGTTNVMFIASIQQDEWFEIYSSADERSAAYIACGMAAASNELIAITCTGATASRNYLPALTEAYYRRLPILIITFLMADAVYENLTPQVIDRTASPRDTVKMYIEIPEIQNDVDLWKANYLINKGILEITHHDIGPVHINLVDTFSYDFSVKSLPCARVIKKIYSVNNFPLIQKTERVGIFIGEHALFSDECINVIDEFCSLYDSVVIMDHTSNYAGNYGVLCSLVTSQEQIEKQEISFDLLIDIGGITGNYYLIYAKRSWRVDPSGNVKDRFHNVEYIFEMTELDFFTKYKKIAEESGYTSGNNSELKRWRDLYKDLSDRLPELPFSNIEVARQLSKFIPDLCCVHFGILNSLRAWNFFEMPLHVQAFCNVGGFGIDGSISTLIGSSIAKSDTLHFLFIGDLAFFYDMNALGNRHIGRNIRILLVNNGCGVEFKHYSHPGSMFGEDTDKYIAAGGHYGNQSRNFVKHYAEDLGFLYLSADNKMDFEKHIHIFTNREADKSIIFEIFTEPKEENVALKTIRNIIHSVSVKQIVKNTLGIENIQKIRSMIRK